MRTLVVITTLTFLQMVNGYFRPGNTFGNCIKDVQCADCREVRRSGYRTIDGTCNNLRVKVAGAAKTPFRRILRPSYVDGYDVPRGWPGTVPYVPTAAQVSKSIFKIEKTNKQNKEGLSILFMTFGQFLDHDFTDTPREENPCISNTDCSVTSKAFQYPCFPIKFTHTGSNCFGFGRSRPVCQYGRRTPRNQLNELSAYIDASQIYSNELKHHFALRKRDGSGQLKITKEGLLPLEKKQGKDCVIRGGCSLAGDSRKDENIALLAMHTLWVREHNRIAKGLRKLNRHWNEEKLYQTTRKIVGGIWQHIVYTEYLPHIVKLKPYRGYNSYRNPAITNAFSSAAFRFGHSLIPNVFPQLNKNFDNSKKPVTLRNAFRNRQYIVDNGIESTMFGLLGNQSNNVDTAFADGAMTKLFIKPNAKGHRDLTAFNIQRGRDHGIPTYGHWRKACRLPYVSTWKKLAKYMQPGAVDGFKKIYKRPHDIDLFAAGIAEKHVYTYMPWYKRYIRLQVGPIFHCLLKFQFESLRDGDRFFYRSRGVFTKHQFNAIKRVTMSRVLCNNLKGIVSIQRQALKAGNAHGQRRVSCHRIPKLDLRAWRDKKRG